MEDVGIDTKIWEDFGDYLFKSKSQDYHSHLATYVDIAHVYQVTDICPIVNKLLKLLDIDMEVSPERHFRDTAFNIICYRYEASMGIEVGNYTLSMSQNYHYEYDCATIVSFAGIIGYELRKLIDNILRYVIDKI